MNYSIENIKEICYQEPLSADSGMKLFKNTYPWILLTSKTHQLNTVAAKYSQYLPPKEVSINLQKCLNFLKIIEPLDEFSAIKIKIKEAISIWKQALINLNKGKQFMVIK